LRKAREKKSPSSPEGTTRRSGGVATKGGACGNYMPAVVSYRVTGGWNKKRGKKATLSGDIDGFYMKRKNGEAAIRQQKVGGGEIFSYPAVKRVPLYKEGKGA